MVRFSKFTPKKEIYEKFEEFLSKLVWRETLFFRPRLGANSKQAPIKLDADSKHL